MGHGLHQVRLADAGRSIDEERIEIAPGASATACAAERGELIGFSDHEVVERVSLR